MRRALGKGLSQLLGDVPEAPTNTVAISDIKPNSRQPRTQFDEEALNELAASITEFGVLQPLIVRSSTDGKYELIAGERRWRASQIAGLSEVPVVIRSATAQASLEIALIENVQREDISAMETAVAYQRLSQEFGLNHEQIAKRVGKSRVSISNTLRLLKLPEDIQESLLHNELSEGHARTLLMVESPIRQQALFNKIVHEGISVREAERLARVEKSEKSPGKTSKKSSSTPSRDPNLSHLELGLSEYFGSPTRIETQEVGGKIVIDFYSDDDLQRILEILGVHL